MAKTVAAEMFAAITSGLTTHQMHISEPSRSNMRMI